METGGVTRSSSSPERLAYWYFRLNGFLTIENFLVHHETRSNPRTDVDILATRFVHRRENVVNPMMDDPRIAECRTFANIIIAEIKTGMCALNGPWTNPNAENMERVLRAIGCTSDKEIVDAAQLLYADGIWSNSLATVRLFAVGERANDELVIGSAQQLEWATIIEFCVNRFTNYRRQKSSNGQWERDGIRLRELAIRNNVESIRRYFGLNPREELV